MSLIISLIFSVLFSVACAKPLRRTPWLFYTLAVLVSIGAVYFTLYPLSSEFLRSVVFAVQKAHVGFGFLVVVMFIGVFSRDSKTRHYLGPVRAELSIFTSILIFGHLALYLSNYLGRFSRFLSLKPSIAISLILALLLLALLVLLAITSFNFIKKNMPAGRWKALQRFSYVFFGLVFFHMLGYLLVPALNGSAFAITSIAVYAVIFLLYLILRVRRALIDKKETGHEKTEHFIS